MKIETPSDQRTTWSCGSCGKLTDGRSGLDDAMDCFCPRCPHCGGLEYDPYGGDECICDMGHPEPVRECRFCGCTEERGCDGGCWWVGAELCSGCAPADPGVPVTGPRWEMPGWRVYRWVDRDDGSIIGTAYYFGRDMAKADMPYMEEAGIEGWCDLGSDLLYRLQRRISSFVEETATRPISWSAMQLSNLAGWFHVRLGEETR